MKTFYHTTLSVNRKSIETNGLIINIGRLSSELGETVKAVYLFNTLDALENALMNWLGEAYKALADEIGINPDDLVLSTFKVDLPDDFDGLEYNEDMYESISLKNIPPKYISYFRED